LASATGKVTLSDWYGNYGKCVIIDHGTVLAHFTAIARHFWSKRDKLSKREIK